MICAVQINKLLLLLLSNFQGPKEPKMSKGKKIVFFPHRVKKLSLKHLNINTMIQVSKLHGFNTVT